MPFPFFDDDFDDGYGNLDSDYGDFPEPDEPDDEADEWADHDFDNELEDQHLDGMYEE